MQTTAQKLEDYLPQSIAGYRVSEPDRYYNPEDLFDYINGGAELFLSYDFRKVISRTFNQPDEPRIVAEIFDMAETKNAFGVFSHDRMKLDHTYGQGSETYEGAILFWKNRFYISILADKETETSAVALARIAEEIDRRIEGTGSLPPILHQVPGEELVPESVFYFHHYVWLNAFFYITGDNLLNIDKDTDAVLAKYGTPEERYYLLMIQYRNQEEAQKAEERFTMEYAPELAEQSVVKLEDDNWTGSLQSRNRLICVFNAPSKEKALNLLDRAEKNYSAVKK